jgi:hypothetical protein
VVKTQTLGGIHMPKNNVTKREIPAIFQILAAGTSALELATALISVLRK